jgi:hypothetical protein
VEHYNSFLELQVRTMSDTHEVRDKVKTSAMSSCHLSFDIDLDLFLISGDKTYQTKEVLFKNYMKC